jgi:hypothetical protein
MRLISYPWLRLKLEFGLGYDNLWNFGRAAAVDEIEVVSAPRITRIQSVLPSWPASTSTQSTKLMIGIQRASIVSGIWFGTRGS